MVKEEGVEFSFANHQLSTYENRNDKRLVM